MFMSCYTSTENNTTEEQQRERSVIEICGICVAKASGCIYEQQKARRNNEYCSYVHKELGSGPSGGERTLPLSTVVRVKYKRRSASPKTATSILRNSWRESHEIVSQAFG